MDQPEVAKREKKELAVVSGLFVHSVLDLRFQVSRPDVGWPILFPLESDKDREPNPKSYSQALSGVKINIGRFARSHVRREV